MEYMTPPPIRIIEQRNSDRKDQIFLYLSMLVGFLFCELILFGQIGVSVPIFVLIFYTCQMWYFRGGALGREGTLLFIPIGLLSLCFGLFDNVVLTVFNVMLLFTLMFVHSAVLSGGLLYPIFSPGTFLDLLHLAIVLPFSRLGEFFKQIAAGGSKGRKGLLKIFIGIVIAVPVVAIVLALLTSADDTFAYWMRSLNKVFSDRFWEYFFKVVLGVLLAIPLFGVCYSLRYKKVIRGMGSAPTMDRAQFADSAIMVTVLTILNVIFVVYLAIQASYLFAVLRDQEPAGFSVTQFARQGFFQLQAVAFLNILVLTAGYVFSKRKEGKLHPALKWMSVTMTALTLLILVTAFTKMMLYVQTYGLTYLRVFTSWFMLVLFVILCATLFKFFFERLRVMKWCVTAFIILYLGLNLANVDAIIPKYNIARYHANTIPKLNLDMYYDMSDAAVPYIVPLLKDKDKKVAADANGYLWSRKERLSHSNDWKAWNLSRFLGERALEGAQITQPTEEWYSTHYSSRVED